MEHRPCVFRLKGMVNRLISLNVVQFTDAPVFYDDRPLLEHFNVASARIWREEYKKSYTDMFATKGIELFK